MNFDDYINYSPICKPETEKHTVNGHFSVCVCIREFWLSSRIAKGTGAYDSALACRESLLQSQALSHTRWIPLRRDAPILTSIRLGRIRQPSSPFRYNETFGSWQLVHQPVSWEVVSPARFLGTSGIDRKIATRFFLVPNFGLMYLFSFQFTFVVSSAHIAARILMSGTKWHKSGALGQAIVTSLRISHRALIARPRRPGADIDRIVHCERVPASALFEVPFRLCRAPAGTALVR